MTLPSQGSGWTDEARPWQLSPGRLRGMAALSHTSTPCSQATPDSRAWSWLGAHSLTGGEGNGHTAESIRQRRTKSGHWREKGRGQRESWEGKQGGLGRAGLCVFCRLWMLAEKRGQGGKGRGHRPGRWSKRHARAGVCQKEPIVLRNCCALIKTLLEPQPKGQHRGLRVARSTPPQAF